MTRPRPIEDTGGRRAQALAHPTRRRLLDLLEAAPDGAGVAELAAALGLHANAVRQHAAVLRDCGLVDQQVARTGGRGRPRTVFTAAPDPGGDAPFERLARLLARVADGRSVAEVGADEAERLAAPHAGQGAVELVAAVAGEHGFAPRISQRGRRATVVLDACPYAAIAGPTVCDLHRTVIDQLAARTGAVVHDFTVAPPPAGRCHLSIETTTEDHR